MRRFRRAAASSNAPSAISRNARGTSLSAARPVSAIPGADADSPLTAAVVGVVRAVVVVVAAGAAVVVGAGVTGIERTGGIVDVVVDCAAAGVVRPTARRAAKIKVRSTRTPAR